MEDDIFRKITKMIPYPWVSRMDRNLYIEHPELDPVKLFQRTTIAAIAGYWIAKIKGWNRPLLCIGATLPLVLIFLHNEWKLKDLKPAGVINFQ